MTGDMLHVPLKTILVLYKVRMFFNLLLFFCTGKVILGILANIEDHVEMQQNAQLLWHFI